MIEANIFSVNVCDHMAQAEVYEYMKYQAVVHYSSKANLCYSMEYNKGDPAISVGVLRRQRSLCNKG